MFYRLEIQNILILFKAVNVTKYQKKIECRLCLHTIVINFDL